MSKYRPVLTLLIVAVPVETYQKYSVAPPTVSLAGSALTPTLNVVPAHLVKPFPSVAVGVDGCDIAVRMRQVIRVIWLRHGILSVAEPLNSYCTQR